MDPTQLNSTPTNPSHHNPQPTEPNQSEEPRVCTTSLGSDTVQFHAFESLWGVLAVKNVKRFKR